MRMSAGMLVSNVYEKYSSDWHGMWRDFYERPMEVVYE
jgi:hypothetical protein